MNHILCCPTCKTYTFEALCPLCQAVTVGIKPAKFSPDDTLGKYRREAKREELKRKGLL